MCPVSYDTKAARQKGQILKENKAKKKKVNDSWRKLLIFMNTQYSAALYMNGFAIIFDFSEKISRLSLLFLLVGISNVLHTRLYLPDLNTCSFMQLSNKPIMWWQHNA